MTQARGSSSSYDALLQLFRDFRTFETPPCSTPGVHDYSPDSMHARERGLAAFRARLEAIDTRGWPVAQQVDHALVRAEMNGLEYNLRVLRPWERDPSFHAVIERHETDVPDREAPCIHGVLRMFHWTFPLTTGRLDTLRTKLAAIPGVLAHARTVLTGSAKDLYQFGIWKKEGEVRALKSLEESCREHHPELLPLIVAAGAAVGDFLAWLKEKYSALPDSIDGIGVEQFNWAMRHVHLVPYDWDEQYALLRRELERSWTALKLEEHRNRRLPLATPPADTREWQARIAAAREAYVRFLSDQDVFTAPPDMRLRGQSPHPPSPEHLDFFSEVDIRGLLPLHCHMVHWYEKQREESNPHPIRREPLLYNIWDSRAEGFATAFEETMLQAGMLDADPRQRELVHILLAFRAARAIGGHRVHSREWTLNQAVAFSVSHTPRGWVRPDGHTILGDMALYIRQPGYGSSYVTGKIQFERLLADRARQLGDAFTLKSFLDTYFASGMIPASLIRWEMTGLDDEIRHLGLIPPL